MGTLTRFFKQSMQRQAFTKEVKSQLNEAEDHRPYFTYWVTFVQVLIFLVSISVFGVAPFGIGKYSYRKLVHLSNLAFEKREFKEERNIWLGPRKQDLIHLGARYPPCMREDASIQALLEQDRKIENDTACCIRNDGLGCVQKLREQCDDLSVWRKWEAGNTGPNGRISGSVCGQDPSHCLSPASVPPYEWKDSIVDWPVCKKVHVVNITDVVAERHVFCNLLGHPCCCGILGECIITTRDHCDLIRGRYHQDKLLCAQTNCFESMCGMIPFARDNVPNQFYRLWTSIFLHGGIIHLLVTIIFQMWIMRDLEKLTGAIRLAIVYIGSGIAGNLASGTFMPYLVEVGPSGSQFGVISCLLVEVLQSYQMYRRPHMAIFKLAFLIMVFFIVGLLPWVDNWSHLFGFLFGFLLSFSLMPYVTFGKFDQRRKMITIVICLGSATGLFICLVLIFYLAPIINCTSCVHFTCFPLSNKFCEKMYVSLKNRTLYGSQ